MSCSIEEKIHALGLALPVVPVSKGVYHSCIEVGDLIYFSGHISVHTDGSYITGKAGDSISDEDAKIAARQCGLAILANIKKQYGSLEVIKRVVKILGMVNAVPEYKNHASVINGCSELFVQLWGEACGKGVRSAVGMGSLPNMVAVEIEGIFEKHTS